MKKIHTAILFFSLFCLILNIYTVFIFENFYPTYLVWNLFLAFIPYLLSIELASLVKNKQPLWMQAALLIIWLIFFPNAMYVVTDFIHLYEQTYLPVWFDIAQIFSYTWIAFFFGFLSLYKIEKIITKKYSSKISYIFIGASTFLASIGVYLGRQLRWNSWDLFIHPWQVIINLVDILSNLENFLGFIAMTTTFTAMFAGVYFSLRALLQSKDK